jgi:hypothetical protein
VCQARWLLTNPWLNNLEISVHKQRGGWGGGSRGGTCPDSVIGKLFNLLFLVLLVLIDVPCTLLYDPSDAHMFSVSPCCCVQLCPSYTPAGTTQKRS